MKQIKKLRKKMHAAAVMKNSKVHKSKSLFIYFIKNFSIDEILTMIYKFRIYVRFHMFDLKQTYET